VQSGASSLYPDDMESMYGESLLFKVGKKLPDVSDEAMIYEVLGLCYDPSLVGMFISKYLTTRVDKVS
jgi:hypothetical protein